MPRLQSDRTSMSRFLGRPHNHNEHTVKSHAFPEGATGRAHPCRASYGPMETAVHTDVALPTESVPIESVPTESVLTESDNPQIFHLRSLLVTSLDSLRCARAEVERSGVSHRHCWNSAWTRGGCVCGMNSMYIEPMRAIRVHLHTHTATSFCCKRMTRVVCAELSAW
jgi:hypothetical protein